MTENEQHHASKRNPKLLPSIMVDPEHPEQAEEQLYDVFLSYADQVKDLGIVSGLLIGSKNQKGGFLWNVFSEETLVENIHDFSPYRNLNKLSYDLQKATRQFMRIRIAHANPSQLEQLKEDCERQNIKTEFVSLIDAEASEEITTKDTL